MTKQCRILFALAGLYAAGMLYLLFFRMPAFTDESYWGQVRMHFNPIPFRTIALYIRLLGRPGQPWLIRLAQVNLFGNILLFIPLGLFPPLLWSWMRRFWKTMLFAAGVMTTVELLQMLLLVGTCDIDDLFLNLLGASLGYLLFYLNFRKKTPAA